MEDVSETPRYRTSIQVFCPYFKILWKEAPCSLEHIKAAGFDGVEFHLIGGIRSQKQVQRVRTRAQQAGLIIRFHQGWSRKTGQDHLTNRILGVLKQLVPNDTPLCVQTIFTGSYPVVVYGNHVQNGHKKNYLYQTASEHTGHRYVSNLQGFVEKVKECKVPVVFDTQHVLEWHYNVQDVTGLQIPHAELLSVISHYWDMLHAFVQEIHICDFDPLLGALNGRNVFLGKGIFPLTEFSEVVRESGWGGVITPEVQPQYVKNRDALHSLNVSVRELFIP